MVGTTGDFLKTFLSNEISIQINIDDICTCDKLYFLLNELPKEDDRFSLRILNRFISEWISCISSSRESMCKTRIHRNLKKHFVLLSFLIKDLFGDSTTLRRKCSISIRRDNQSRSRQPLQIPWNL